MRRAIAIAAVAGMFTVTAHADAPGETGAAVMGAARAMILQARAAVCPGPNRGPIPSAIALAERLGYAQAEGPDRRGWITLTDPTRGRMLLAERRRGTRLDGYELQADVPIAGLPRPVMMARFGPDCAQVLARAIDHDATGRAQSIRDLDDTLHATGSLQVLDPPVPVANDPGGVRVGHIDSGVNYLLPVIGLRLARRADGGALGWDYWDDDPRPFDLNPAGSPFFPLHHGTAVASVLLAEAPRASLIAYRYPRPDMTRMAALVEAAANAGAVVVMVPMGSAKRDDWQAFEDAARRHPNVLFVVSAGNDGRDIDLQPVYPAALNLDNMVVVTSADDFGRLAPGSNWGAESVDLMVPGEAVAVIDHRGATGKASGSSFAVPRLAALAARMKARHPDWHAAELIEALKARAAPPMMRGVAGGGGGDRGGNRGGAVVKFGWIANPLDDG